MIGNDIVDLQVAKKESNWQRRGFLDKLFTNEEQELIKFSSDPFQMVWLLWTMKESAYKACLHQNYNRIFSPKSIKINLISKCKATVIIHNTMFYTQSEIKEELIHTIASSQKEADIILTDFFKLNNTAYEAQAS
ncbi:MAG: 4'-phosphopantetheinyl transferase superfamily protein [Flavobacteriaceae bacterium]|nr:4'-phosphopantetheinyl transferase superfamily protein [Flavobacteriaceae bacterium]